MHEVGIMQRTIEIALEHAKAQNADKIHRIKIRVGALSGVIPDALSFAFDVCTRSTIAEGAKLEVEYIPVLCFCPDCELTFQPDDVFYECPQCHQISTEVRQGKELELSSLEVSSNV